MNLFKSETQEDSPIKAIDELLDRQGASESNLIELMQDVSKLFGYLPRPALERMAERTEVPLSRLYAIATFYQDFKLQPQGQHRLEVCAGTACHVKGAAGIADSLSRELGLEAGETTEDGKLTFETVNCVGLCGVGPIVILNGEYHSNMTVEKAMELVEEL